MTTHQDPLWPDPTASPSARQGGPWTSHGHDIPGVTRAGHGRPPVARCGGPALCVKCGREALRAINEKQVTEQEQVWSQMQEALDDQQQHRPSVYVSDDASVQTVPQYAIRLADGSLHGSDDDPYIIDYSRALALFASLRVQNDDTSSRPAEIVVRRLTVVTGAWESTR